MKIPVARTDYRRDFDLGQPVDDSTTETVFLYDREALLIECDEELLREFHFARHAWREVQNKIDQLYYEAEEAAYEAARTKPIELNADNAEEHEKLNLVGVNPTEIDAPLETEIKP